MEDDRKKIATLKDDLRRAVRVLLESDPLLGWAAAIQVMNEEQARVTSKGYVPKDNCLGPGV